MFGFRYREPERFVQRAMRCESDAPLPRDHQGRIVVSNVEVPPGIPAPRDAFNRCRIEWHSVGTTGKPG